MAPPKCFFKRPGQFYGSGNTAVQSLKYESYSTPTSPNNEIIPNLCIDNDNHYSISPMKSEPTVFDLYKNLIKNESVEESTDSPLDLSCKFLLPENNILKKLNRFFQQKIDSNILSNLNLNLENLLYQLPPQLSPTINLPVSPNQKPNPNIFISPPHVSDISWKPPYQQTVDRTLLNTERITDEFRFRHSPDNSLSVIDSGQENSSSETSSQCTTNQRRKRSNKRHQDNKVIRPFKLYKGTDSKSLLEAIGITEQDEEWLKNLIEKQNVDVFQILSNVMNGTHKEDDLSDEMLEKIKLKFGHIFENCNTTISNPRMVRHPDMTPKELKTEEYWEKRRKNNEAAKRSREARRQKEEGLTNHCEDLQIENDKIRKEIENVKLQIQDIKKYLS